MNKDNINIIVGIIAIAVIVIIAIKIFKPQNTETFRKFIQQKEYMDNVSFDESKEGNMNKLVNQKLDEADVIVDAIFGIGLSRNVEGIFKKVIKLINSYEKYTVSIDIPSGLNGNTGKIMGICVKANETITVETYKKGFFLGEANEYTGKISLIKIGYPENVKNLLSEEPLKEKGF